MKHFLKDFKQAKKMRDLICIIPARGGSKRIKNKNILKFFKIPFLGRTINTAKKSQIFDQIVVSSDSKKILNVGKKYGATSISQLGVPIYCICPPSTAVTRIPVTRFPIAIANMQCVTSCSNVENHWFRIRFRKMRQKRKYVPKPSSNHCRLEIFSRSVSSKTKAKAGTDTMLIMAIGHFKTPKIAALTR